MDFRSLFLSIFLILMSSFAFSQKYQEMNLKELNYLKNKAVQNEEFEKAHKIKKIIELKEKLDAAIAKEDYLEASKLEKQIKNIFGKNSSDAVTASTSIDGEPYNLEFYNTIYVYNDEVGSEGLEKQTAEIRTSSYSAVWVAGSSSFWEVSGNHSPIQITNAKNYTFLVRVAKGIDPSRLFRLVQLELIGEEKIKRSLLSFKTTAAAYAGASTKQNNDNKISISFKKVSNEVYEIIIDEVIPPGEYAFVNDNNWYLFGSKHQFTNSDQLEITEREFTDGHLYDEEGDFPKTVWLGIDYSMLKVKGNISVEHEVMQESLLKAVDKIYSKIDNNKEIGILLRREKTMIWNPLYMKEFIYNSSPTSYIIPENLEYVLTEELIESHLNMYEINYPNLGLVIIPEIFDLQNKEFKGRAVWFDFDTRRIIYSVSHTRRLSTKEDFKERHVWADFYDFTKEIFRGEYDKNFRAYN